MLTVPMQNYFELLGLEKRFAIDYGELDKKYFKLQREFHPDKLINKLESERNNSIKQSTIANEAYQTLKSNIKRAKHLLELEGVEVLKEASPALLMEMMELKEKISDIGDIGELIDFETKLLESYEKNIAMLSQEFENKNFKAASLELTKLQYLSKSIEDIAAKKLQLK